jgi:hypothetical protein
VRGRFLGHDPPPARPRPHGASRPGVRVRRSCSDALMAKSEVTLTVRVSDMERFRLFIWELWQLHDEMRVMASPHADRLERLIDRFTTDWMKDDRV